uniref:BZIP domain-containing protein n=1 Tax=Bionectria ochroleuca TaxID=29856 RepID=A0A0B7KRP7_BIOOC
MPPQHQVQPTSTRTSPPAPRQYCGRGTSSTFSNSANPEEDWTKISDLAERRKIQNRIAQRNYRKKLKRRLEDLERGAGSSDTTDSQNTTSSAPKIKRPAVSKAFLKPQKETPPSKSIPQMQLTPPLESNNEFFLSPTNNNHERSHTPPMIFYSNTNYPFPDNASLKTPYNSTQYQSMVTGAESYPSYMVPTTVSIIPLVMDFNGAIKRGFYLSDNGIASSGYLYP